MASQIEKYIRVKSFFITTSMNKINIWELGIKISIKPNKKFLKDINLAITKLFKSKEKFYNLKIRYKTQIPYQTFKNFLKYSYYNKGCYAPLNSFLLCCGCLGISKIHLQQNIESYKTQKGYNVIVSPILPIKITPIFDMILAHNIADGTVIDSKRNRQIYFGYRQFDKEVRGLYIKKIESIFGKIKFKKENYFENSTRSYCPPVLSQLFFSTYNLNKRSFLSKRARIPIEIMHKNKNFLLSVLLAFIIDEGNIDSTLINISLKNVNLTEDLYKICIKLNYPSKFNIKGEYGKLYILRGGMKKLFKDYKKLLKKYPEAYLGKSHKKIEEGLKIYNRVFYKTKGNKNIILKMLELEDLTVNQIANKINMTRQGVRFHINNLEDKGEIIKKSFIGKKCILYGIKGKC